MYRYRTGTDVPKLYKILLLESIVLYQAVFRIRMDPGFFADPDPDFKNPDPDPSVFCF